MQLNIFQRPPQHNLLYELFQAYFDCRKNKRNTINALMFERNFESRIFELHDEIVSGIYTPRRCIAFIVNKPVKREIFAADFRDRVVHHFLIRKINPFFEKLFISNSFACRVGKGTLHGILSTSEALKKLSEAYKKDVYMMKLDISGFFMNIDRNLLYKRLSDFMHEQYCFNDLYLIEALFRQVIFQDPASNCIIKGAKSDWEGLPPGKSLFSSKPDCGLPIGNLTSQVLANFYLHPLDEFITGKLDDGYYGRYVDDFVMIHHSKQFLLDIKYEIERYLHRNLKLDLHPRKMVLQHYAKGIPFLGAIIKPYRLYCSSRTKGNFFRAVCTYVKQLKSDELSKKEVDSIVSSVNSYAGHLMHFNTWRLRCKLLSKLKDLSQLKLHVKKGFVVSRKGV